MTTGQNKSLPKPSPGKKSLVLPQVRYHPSIQNSLDSGINSRAQKMEKAQSQKKERPKGTSSRAGDVYGRSSGQDSGTTAENVLLKATKSDKAISTVSEGPKSSPFSQDPNSGSPPQDASPKGAGLGAKGPTKPHSAKMPQTRYHPSIQNPQVCTRNGTSQKSVRTKDCERSAVKKNHTGTDLESSSPQATSSRAGDGDGLNSGLSSEGPHPGTTPKGTPPKGKKQNGRSRASVLPQTGTGQEERNERTTGGDAPEPDDTVTPEEAPRGSEVLRLDPLVLRVGSTLDQSLVEKVEVLTRGQSTNPEWFTARKNRITASVAHNIAHCRYVQDKSTAPPVSYLKAITGNRTHTSCVFQMNPTLSSAHMTEDMGKVINQLFLQRLVRCKCKLVNVRL